jgi:hypothetical protein
LQSSHNRPGIEFDRQQLFSGLQFGGQIRHNRDVPPIELAAFQNCPSFGLQAELAKSGWRAKLAATLLADCIRE